MTESSQLRKPNGGWGWMVVFGTALVNVFNQSLLSMFGLVFGPKLEAIAGTTGITTVMSINCTVSNFSGFLISPLLKFLTTKQITQIGVLFVSGGLILSSYTQNYIQVVTGYGLFTGLGLGLIASSTFLIINSYFSSNKSQAVGLSMAGTSLGQMAMPPIVALLVKYYDYNGTILILGGLSLHGLLGSIFFQPVKKHMKDPANPSKSNGTVFTKLQEQIYCRGSKRPVVIENNLRANLDSQDCNAVQTSNKNTNVSESFIHNNSDIDVENNDNCFNSTDSRKKAKRLPIHVIESLVDPTTSQTEIYIKKKKSKNENDDSTALYDALSDHDEEEFFEKPSFCQKIVKLFDLGILLDPSFVHIMIGLSFAYTTSISFSTFFPLFLTEDLNMTIIEASLCMTVLSLMDFIGRILVPLLTKRMNISHRLVFIIGSLLLAVCRSVLVLQTAQEMVLLLSAVCGLARAATVINQNLVIAEYSKEAHVSSAVGLNMVSKGVFVLTIGRLLGLYKDSAHQYGSVIHILNIISFGVVVSWSTELLFKKIFCRN